MIKKITKKKPLLIKLGSEEHMKKFYEEGELYLQTFNYFRNLEQKEDGRADPDEYLGEYYAGEGLKCMKFTISITNNETKETKTFELNEETVTSIAMGNPNPVYTHIYCMSGIDIKSIRQHSTLISAENFTGNKEYAVVVFDCDEFAKRIINVAKEKDIQALKMCKVEYVDRKNYGGNMDCFHKFDNYAYQNEWRVAFRIPSSETCEKLYIGSMQDIAYPPVHRDTFLNTPILPRKCCKKQKED